MIAFTTQVLALAIFLKIGITSIDHTPITIITALTADITFIYLSITDIFLEV
jgi:hypothetical protein